MTNKCPRCDVEVDHNLTNCPLCGAFVENNENEFDANEYENNINYGYPKVRQNFVIKKLLLKVVLYFCIISIGICMLVNYLTSPTKQLDWSFHIIFGWIVYWCTLGRTMFFHLDMRKQIYWYSVFACIICFHIQFSIEKTIFVEQAMNWALIWATPSFLMGGVAGLVLYMLIKWKDWVRFVLPLTAMCLTCILPTIIGFCIYKDVHFMLYICMGVGVITLLFMMIVGKDKYFLELKKKFFI